MVGEKRGAYGVLVGKPEGRRPHGRPSRRWEDNINTDLREVGWETLTGLIWLRIWTGGSLEELSIRFISYPAKPLPTKTLVCIVVSN
jgi:hypothetical protein